MLLTLMFDYLSGQTIFVFIQLIVLDWILLIKRQALTCLLQQRSFSFSAVYVYPTVPLRRVNSHLFGGKVSLGPRPDQDCREVRSAGDHAGRDSKRRWATDGGTVKMTSLSTHDMLWPPEQWTDKSRRTHRRLVREKSKWFFCLKQWSLSNSLVVSTSDLGWNWRTSADCYSTKT